MINYSIQILKAAGMEDKNIILILIKDCYTVHFSGVADIKSYAFYYNFWKLNSGFGNVKRRENDTFWYT